MLLEKIKKFWKAGLVETIKDTFMPFGSKKEKKKNINFICNGGYCYFGNDWMLR